MKYKLLYLNLLSITFFFNGFSQIGKRGIDLGSDSTTVTGNTYAIIIGISQYKLVPSLQFAHKDAQAFEDFLLSAAGGKVPKANIETFLNENANKNNVADAISIIAKSQDRGTGFISFLQDMEIWKT